MTVVGGMCKSLGGPVLLPLAPKHPPLGPGRILTEDSREREEEVELSWPRAQPEDARRLCVPWGDPHRERPGEWRRLAAGREATPGGPQAAHSLAGTCGRAWAPVVTAMSWRPDWVGLHRQEHRAT